jgi:hypothetical protein
MFQKSELTLDGIGGTLVDRGEAGSYWESTLESSVIKKFTTKNKGSIGKSRG